MMENSGTSSSSQSQSVPSSASMESTSTAPTLPTQDIVDGAFGSDDEDARIERPPVWGRLFPLRFGFQLAGKKQRNP